MTTWADTTSGLRPASVLDRGLNVREAPYSATGNGVTDDTAAINAAISAAMIAGVDVYFPPGNYVVSNLTMDFSTFALQGASGPPYGYRGVRLMGASQRQVLLTQKSGATGAMLLIQGQIGTNAGLANNNKATGVVVENLEFVGTSGAGNHAITLRSITNCLIRNVMISACGGSGIYMQRDTFTGSNDEYFYAVHVEDSRIVACSRYGIEGSAQAAISAALTNVDIEACTLGGILVNPALFSLRGCTVFGCGGVGLKVTPNAVALSANFALSAVACRFEGNCQSSGSYEIMLDGCPGYVLEGLAVLATAASGPHCLGLGTAGTGKVNHHGLIMGGYYTGNASTAGQKWIVTGADDQNPIALSPRINFSGFAGGAVIPNSLITGGATLLYLDPANIRPAADGWIDWTRRISTPGSPSASGARMFNRASAVDGTKGQLVIKWPGGNVSTMAHEGAPSDWGTAAPTTGAHVVGEIVWNSAPSVGQPIGWVCTAAGTPGTWQTFGIVAASGGAAGVFLNVMDYGAVGDGTTNDSTAIQTALTAAGTAGGGVVWFPAHTYLCNGLQIPSNVKLRGCGWASILKQPTALPDNTWLLSSFGTGTGTSTNKVNIEISDLQLVGRADVDTATQYVHLIDLAGVSDVVIERCLFKAWRGDAIDLASNDNAGTQLERHNERVTIRDCRFDGVNPINRNGITVTDGTDVLIENNTFFNCTATNRPGAIDIEPNANAYHRIRNIQILHNSFDTISGNAGVIGMFLNQAQTAYTIPMRGLQIIGNTIRNCTNSQGPIFLNQVQTPVVTTERNEILIADNTILDSSGSAIEAWGIRGLRIDRNYVNGISNGLAIGYGTKCMDVHIVRNDFQRVGLVDGNAITIYTVDRLRIEFNVFDNIGDQAGTGRLTSFGQGSGGTSTSTEVEFIYNRVIGTQATTIANKAAGHTLSVDSNAYYGNDTLALVPSSAHWAMNETLDADAQPVVTVTYSASMTPDASLGSYQKITPTNTTAMTINAPTAPVTGTFLTFDFLNSSGGTMGVVTWNAVFKLAGAFTNPANTKRRTITFRYDGTSWVEMSRAAADI